MEKLTTILEAPAEKDHSVRFDSSDQQPAVRTIYVMKSALGSARPKKIKVTIEEVS